MQEPTSQSRPPSIYKPPQQKSRWPLSLGKFWGHRTLSRVPPDARTPASGAQELVTCPPLNLARQSLTATCEPPDASSTHRTRAQRVCQTQISPDSEHRMRLALTRLMRGEDCKIPSHRTHTTGRTQSIRCSQSDALYLSQATPDA